MALAAATPHPLVPNFGARIQPVCITVVRHILQACAALEQCLESEATAHVWSS